MGIDPIIIVPLVGILVGTLLGFIARSTHFCTLQALERYWYADDGVRIRIWVLAAASAAAFTQALIGMNAIDVSDTFYLNPQLPLTGHIVGGIAFGFGMALVGTCGFGAILRAGGGSLKAAVALIVLGLSALAAQRGLIAQLRVQVVDNLAVDLSAIGDQSAGALTSAFAGTDLKMPTAIMIIGLTLIWIFAHPQMRQHKAGITTGIAMGALITCGWVVTDWGTANAFDPIQIEAGSFVVPVGDTLMQFATYTGVLPDYGVGLVLGVLFGAVLAAWRAHDVRWEACDDARELGRHLAGAFLMGTGGVFAFGCTIGQGVSAASLLAISAPITMISVAIGARLGLAWLLEGSIWSVLLGTDTKG